jgi:hypothetical protein
MRFSPWVLVTFVTLAFAVVAWSGIEQWRDSGGDDAFAYRDYSGRLYYHHHLPAAADNYEYSLPPGAPELGVAATWMAKPIQPDRPSPPFQWLPRHLRRVLWLLLAGSGVALLASSRPVRPSWLTGIFLSTLAFGLAAEYAYDAVMNQRWLPLVLISYVSAVALVPLTAWLAHEVWPDWRWAPFLGSGAVVLMPTVFAATLYFHPDPPFAVASVIASALAVRALRTGLTVWAGIGLGVTLGAAALIRQSAPAIAIALGLAILLVAGRGAWRYLAAAATALAVTAGPWWLYQTLRFHNPIKANLDRPGYMLDHQPLSFYVSFPLDLITHPRSPSFKESLLPRFHAYLWSDWGGGYHHWGETKHLATFFASTQSVLGFGGDALVLGGVAFIGLPALWRRSNPALTVLTTLFLLSWGAFIATLIRFPQKEGDPIKAHYLLFLAPVSAVFGVASARALIRQGGWQRNGLYVWLALYSASWGMTLATAF